MALKYTGKDLNEDTGLYYFNARWYDANTGRFISEDPARDGAAWYVYCSNNPLKFTDPTGMWGRKNKDEGSGGDGDKKSLGDRIKSGLSKVRDFFSRGSGTAGGNSGGGDHGGNNGPDKPKNESGVKPWSLDSVQEGFAGAWQEAKTLPEVTVQAVIAAEEGLKQAGSIVASQIPGVGDVKDAVEALSGIDPITGQQLSKGEQIAAAVAVVAGPVLSSVTARKIASGVELGTTGTSVLKGSPDIPKNTDFVIDASGTAYPVPKNATGPSPVTNASGNTTGAAFTGGQGGANGQVSTMRMMDPTPPRGKSPGYENGYIKYENKSGQGVDPYSGRTISNRDSHYPIGR